MALTLSTGVVDSLMSTGAFRTVMADCFIDIYQGSRPADPNSAATAADKIVTISVGGDGVTGLDWEANSTGGVLEKDSGQTWTGTSNWAGGAGGQTRTATWFRIRLAADTNANGSTTEKRVDGSIGTGSGDLNLASQTVAYGAPFVISTAQITLPRGI